MPVPLQSTSDPDTPTALPARYLDRTRLEPWSPSSPWSAPVRRSYDPTRTVDGGWTLLVDGVEQSYVCQPDPTELRSDYTVAWRRC